MKKIVALVLSLVMALSLCTVAFGVQDTVYAAADGKVDKKTVEYTAFDTVKAHTAKAADEMSNVEYYVVVDAHYWVAEGSADDPVRFDVDDKSDIPAAYINSYWKLTEVTEYAYLVPCSEDDATLALYKNGVFNTWLFRTANEELAYYDLTGEAQAATTAKPNCTTDLFVEDGYIGDDDCFYIAVDPTKGYEKAMNVDGKIVFVDEKCDDTDYVIWASHIFAKGVKNDKTGYDVAKCLICGGEFACTNSTEVATKNGYKISTGFTYSSDRAANVYDENKYENGYDFSWGQAYAGDYEYVWQLKAGTTEEIGTANKADTETKTEGVESAKTFDAGIAMYVGMSLMSVAGTAVVIGKKKEF